MGAWTDTVTFIFASTAISVDLSNAAAQFIGGSDTIVYAEGDATVALADVISDFQDGSDLIGLTGGLTFGQLTIDQSSNLVGGGALDTQVIVAATSEILTVLDGVTPTIDGTDFV